MPILEGVRRSAVSEQNKAVLRRFFTEVWSEGDLALIDELLARDCLGHAAHYEFGGREVLKQLVAAQRMAYPDLQITVEDQIAEGDKVATRWKARGTDPGEFQGRPATGKTEMWTGITIARLANGKVIEGWTNADDLSTMRLLDVIASLTSRA